MRVIIYQYRATARYSTISQLAFSTIHYRAIRNKIRAQNTDLDKQTLAHTVEGLTDLHEIVMAVI